MPEKGVLASRRSLAEYLCECIRQQRQSGSRIGERISVTPRDEAVRATGRRGEAEGVLAPLGQTAKSYTVHCVGHAHIDTAWLWPLAETQRKMVRTFSFTLSGNNLFDVNARRHASFLKDYAPLAGRDIRVTARLEI